MTGPASASEPVTVAPQRESETDDVVADAPSDSDSGFAEEAGWQRLHPRVVWVDTAKALLSLIPGSLAVFVFGQEINGFFIGSACVATIIGVLGAIADLLRWVKTRYRITSEHVELRTGFFFRKHRTVRIERIRSIDAKAKLRHRLAGLRILRIEAGQQSTGEAAFALDAVSTGAAHRLREQLLYRAKAAAGTVAAQPVPDEAEAEGERASTSDSGTVLARFQGRWFVHNIFNIWAFLMAAGLTWGVTMLSQLVGLDISGWYFRLLNGWGFGLWQSIATTVAVLGVIGVVGLIGNFFTENWKFRLTRSRHGTGSTLRTEKGLFSTREVNRDEARLRGVQIRRPLLWRWLGTANTSAISTGLSMFSDARDLLPNTHIRVARRVARLVLPVGGALFGRRLDRHPVAALRRRLFRATVVTTVVTGVIGYLGATIPGFSGTAWIYCGAILWPVSLGLAVAAYRSLGHLVEGDYVVTRSGATGTSTAVLQRRAIIGWRFRQSIFQRRLDLLSVTAATAAGDKEYQVLDATGQGALRFADAALPGLLRPFLETAEDRTDPRRQRAQRSER